MSRSVMLSLLVDQHARLGDAFLERYNHPWLVWNARRWSAPSADGQTRIVRLPSSPPPPREMDALCLALTFKGDAKRITLGRATDNDIVINDGTVSRHHAVITRARSGTWQVQPLLDSSGTICGSQTLSDRDLGLISDRQKLIVGAVELTFYESRSFLELLRPHGFPQA
jgi:hypothetical protein